MQQCIAGQNMPSPTQKHQFRKMLKHKPLYFTYSSVHKLTPRHTLIHLSETNANGNRKVSQQLLRNSGREGKTATK